MGPRGEANLRRRKIGKGLDDVSNEGLKASVVSWPGLDEKDGQRGRPRSLTDAELFHRRDQLHGIFAAHWPTVGWALQHAWTRSRIRAALDSLADLKHPIIQLCIWDTSAKTLPDEARLVQKERKKLYRELTEIENRLGAAHMSVTEGEDAFARAQNSFAVASDACRYALKKRKKKKAESLLKEVQRLTDLCRRVHTELSKRKETLHRCDEGRRTLKKTIKDTEAHFAQTELLEFVLSERYVFNPLNFANATAGLPFMSWRNSVRLCKSSPCLVAPSINYLIFEAVKLILEQARPTSAEEAFDEIQRQVTKKDQFKTQSEYLGERWPALKEAVRSAWGLAANPGVRPYEITSLFLRDVKSTQPSVNPLLDALEKELSDA